MRQPFSMIGPPGVQRSAVGEGGYHLPVQPDLSGQEAVDSLIGYYPTKRMDSLLDPKKYKVPSVLRSTTMPNTKIADLREKYAANLLAGLQTDNSQFVQGFLVKCAESKLSALQLVAAIQQAMHTHPHIATEFQKCGMLKQAIGSGNGIGMPLQAPGAIPKTTLPKAPVQPPIASPSRASMITGKLPTPAPRPVLRPVPQPATPPAVTSRSQESWLTAPFNTARELTNGGPVAQHFFGFTRTNPATSETVPHVNNAGESPDAFQRVGSTGRSILGGLGAIPAVGVDTLRGATGQGWNMDYSKMMARDVLSGVNTNLDVDMGHDVAARPSGDFGDIHIGPDEGRQFFGNTLHANSGQESLSATHARAKQMMAESQRPNAEGGKPLNRIANATVAPLLEHAEPILGGLVGSKLPLIGAAPKAGLRAVGGLYSSAAPISGVMQAREEMMTHPAVAEQQRQGDTAARRADDADLAAGKSPITQSPQYGEVENFVKQSPDQAKEFANQAQQQLMSGLKTPEGQFEAKHAIQNGTLSPAGQQKAVAALSGEGYDWDQATKTVQGMNGWEQLGLWGGLGMSALALLHAMSGGGGIGSIIMSLLGLGTAGFMAGKAGLLDQGSQDLAKGLSDTFNPPALSDSLKSTVSTIAPLLGDAKSVAGDTVGGILNTGRDAALRTTLQKFVASNPELAAQLDRAAGTGSWGNAALGQLGDITGMRQSMMQDKLGLNPQQQDKLLSVWRGLRGNQ